MRTRDWLLLVFLSLLWGASFFLPPSPCATSAVDAGAGARFDRRADPAGDHARARPHAAERPRPGAPTPCWRSSTISSPSASSSTARPASPAALASVLNATTPLFALILARLFAGEALTAAKLGGVLLGILGVAVLVGPRALGANAASVDRHAVHARRGVVLRLLRALDAAAAGHPADGVGASQLRARRCCCCRCRRRRSLLGAGHARPPATSAVLGLAALSTALAYVVFFRISAAAGPSNVMLVTLLIPVPRRHSARCVLGERLDGQSDRRRARHRLGAARHRRTHLRRIDAGNTREA